MIPEGVFLMTQELQRFSHDQRTKSFRFFSSLLPNFSLRIANRCFYADEAAICGWTNPRRCWFPKHRSAIGRRAVGSLPSQARFYTGPTVHPKSTRRQSQREHRAAVVDRCVPSQRTSQWDPIWKTLVARVLCWPANQGSQLLGHKEKLFSTKPVVFAPEN